MIVAFVTFYYWDAEDENQLPAPRSRMPELLLGSGRRNDGATAKIRAKVAANQLASACIATIISELPDGGGAGNTVRDFRRCLPTCAPFRSIGPASSPG
jgi:hypothetical protein